MRSHEERIAKTKRRIAAREWTQRIRRNRCIMVATTVACLALLVVAALSMPNITAQSPAANDTGFEMAASMYSESAALGYIIIGLLAFLLGVCVTILCFRLRQMNRENEQNKESEDRHGID